MLFALSEKFAFLHPRALPEVAPVDELGAMGLL